MIRRVSAILLLSLLCFQALSETTTNNEPIGLQIGKRFISGPLVLIGGNETIIIDEYTVVKLLIITDEGVRLIPNITEMCILPSYTQINETGMFSIQLHVSPSQPIKAVEINMSFNPSHLQVINITEGDLFEGYPTFFVVHDVDNGNGFLVAYGLIIGPGNTSDDGNFAEVTFNATAQGMASLTFTYVGITNETQYVELSIENATIYVAYSWDIVPDRFINYIDISSLITHYGQFGTPGWIRDDINDDGNINYLELSALITHYGIHY